MVASAEDNVEPRFFQGDKTRVDFGESDDVKIDPAFVLDPELRPRTRDDELRSDDDIGALPLLDLSVLRSISAKDSEKSELGDDVHMENIRRRKLLVEEVGRACQDWGFFQVVNHGVEAELLSDLFAEVKKFFHLPRDEKRRVVRTKDSPTVGYDDSQRSSRKNVRDWKEAFDFTVRDTVTLPEKYDEKGQTTGKRVFTNSWPTNPPRFREACKRWAEAMEKLSFELLELITESMGLPATYFHKHFSEIDTTFIRLNHYPECPNPELALGINQHKDSGALTVLWQDDTGGLEIKRKNGEWMGVTPRREAFVINLGDLFQVWSNNKYMSVEHRVVVNNKKDRYSIPYFFNPDHTTQISPVSELIDANTNPPKYRPYSWGHFYEQRRYTNTNKSGFYVQINHFAIT